MAQRKCITVPVSWEGKTEEHSMCVGDCIDSDRDRFTAKGVVCVPIRPVLVPIRPVVGYGSPGKKGLPALYSVLPPASNVGGTRTVLSVLSHTMYNH